MTAREPVAFERPILVTRPLMPPLADYVGLLEGIWEREWLTNNGRLAVRLEEALRRHLGVEALSLFNNGTSGLQLAIAAMRLTGEVITTPFTFPATPHAISFGGLEPVFADVDPKTLCLSPEAVERALTPRTSAILAVHVYGVPCDVEALAEIARRRGLKLLYDGAHAFGLKIGGRPIAAFGDATMFSFHATKLFHSIEGGAVGVGDPDLKRRMDLLRNFGIRDEDHVDLPGINAKMNEFAAAMGLLVLDRIEAEVARRAEIAAVYEARLADVDGLEIVAPGPDVTSSRQYFVIRLHAGHGLPERDAFVARMRAFNVFPRRYFHPLCSEAAHYRASPSAAADNLPEATRASREVIALPFYGALGPENAERVAEIIRWIAREGGGRV